MPPKKSSTNTSIIWCSKNAGELRVNVSRSLSTREQSWNISVIFLRSLLCTVTRKLVPTKIDSWLLLGILSVLPSSAFSYTGKWSIMKIWSLYLSILGIWTLDKQSSRFNLWKWYCSSSCILSVEGPWMSVQHKPWLLIVTKNIHPPIYNTNNIYFWLYLIIGINYLGKLVALCYVCSLTTPDEL
jgi:hypothetical protein